MEQLNVFEQLKEQTRIDVSLEKPYRNGFGELLPWEDPELLKRNREELEKV